MKKLILLIAGLNFLFGSVVQAYVDSDLQAVPSVNGSTVSQVEQIDDYKVSVHISKKNTAEVTEEIRYNFGALEKHGIYRDIPIDLIDGPNKYYMELQYHGTRDENNNSVQSKEEEISGASGAKNFRIRLGSPDVLVKGQKTYIISYTLKPILLKKGQHPFFNFDAIGTGWTVPIKKANLHVSTDGEVKLSNVKCFVGRQGTVSTDRCQISGNNFSAENLTDGEGMTINAELPTQYVSTYLEPNKARPVDWLGVGLGAATAVLPFILFSLPFVAIFVYLGIRAHRSSKRRKSQIVVAQYTPPTSLSPAEIGLLEDDMTSTQEIAATIIQWAVLGYVRVNFDQSDKSIILAKTNNPPQGLPVYEQALYDAIFKEYAVVTVSKLDTSIMAMAVQTFRTGVVESLTTKGYYAKNGNIFDKGNLTDEGAKEWALVDGFRLFIEVVEKDRLAFSDSPEKTPERFNAILPYAIALGVEKEWTKQFEGIDLSSATNTWYNGTDMRTLNMSLLASSLTNSLSSVSTPPSSSNSSFSSGGGSSGGGAGGGGGGSW